MARLVIEAWGQAEVFQVKAITRRRDPIFYALHCGFPVTDAQSTMGLGIEAATKAHLSDVEGGIDLIDVRSGPAASNMMLVLKLRPRYPGQAKKVMSAIWGFGQMMFSKCIIVMDHDTNIQDIKEVAWRALNNIDAKRDIVFTEGPVDELDHSANADVFGSKMGIDATRKSAEEGMQRDWPEDMVMAEDIKRRVTERWLEYGLDK